MAQGNPLPGEKYLHFKDKMYQIVAIAYHSETMERFVVYQALYGEFRTFIRPYDMFISEVDHEKYPDVKQKFRFQFAGNPADEPMPEEDKTGMTAGREAGADPALPQPEECKAPEGVNPWLIRFLDAEGVEERYRVVCDMHNDIDDRLIDDIAVVMDVAVPEGKLSERYAQLKYCIRTRQRYEGSRHR